MRHITKLIMVVLVGVSLLFAGCSSSKKGQCGCPAKQGMIGY
jgi:hypothetical protein